MNLHEALYTTRAMRRLRPDPIPLDVQARILDAAIRAPHVVEQWRFLLIDDRDLMAELAVLYRAGSDRFLARMGMTQEAMVALPGAMGRAGRSAAYQVDHFAEVPLLLIGVDRTSDGCGIYPALWSAMLAARAEGIGSTMTTMLSNEMGAEVRALLGVPEDEGWVMHGAVPMGYPLGPWGLAKRQPVEAVVRRNGWQGEAGFNVPEPLWTPQLD
ncbi:MAG: nitroreductase family protein [Thermomicrobiales bacterium]